METELPGWVVPSVVLGAFVGSSVWETFRPLRHRVEARGRRIARNLGVAAVSFAAVGGLQAAGFSELAGRIEESGPGLLHLVPLPDVLALALGILLLDWTLWVWHMLNHRLPFLWRFHAVHHVDLDLDASTALRFHFGERVLSLGFRVAQLVVIGPSLLAFGIWQTLLFASILFHHGNIRLPFALERRLVHLVVTPRMHGIHHSVIREERDGNYASLFTLWDRLHGTLRLNVPQHEVEIGVPSHRDARRLTLAKILAQPFGPLPPDPAARARTPAPEGSVTDLAR
jgi:sterol desaturase/sphingolipid hydroxylase (fatty acid hydroxylase superfamily)